VECLDVNVVDEKTKFDLHCSANIETKLRAWSDMVLYVWECCIYLVYFISDTENWWREFADSAVTRQTRCGMCMHASLLDMTHRRVQCSTRRTSLAGMKASSSLLMILKRVMLQLRFVHEDVHSIYIKSLMCILVTFCMSRRQHKMYFGHLHLCVCLSVCLSVRPWPYAHTAARTRM